MLVLAMVMAPVIQFFGAADPLMKLFSDGINLMAFLGFLFCYGNKEFTSNTGGNHYFCCYCSHIILFCNYHKDAYWRNRPSRGCSATPTLMRLPARWRESGDTIAVI
jgi:hypothetical protein